jgi:hypothetical protein
MTSRERLTIDMTVVRDYLDPARAQHQLALELFARAEAGDVNLAVAPQGHRFDASGPLAQQVAEVLELEGVEEARQLAYLSDHTYPSDNLYPGQVVAGFSVAWAAVLATWGSTGEKGRMPGDADRFHAETHVLEDRAIFVTDDKGLCVACQRVRDEHGFAINAMSLADYLDSRAT